jgi:hypothetical protein
MALPEISSSMPTERARHSNMSTPASLMSGADLSAIDESCSSRTQLIQRFEYNGIRVAHFSSDDIFDRL